MALAALVTALADKARPINGPTGAAENAFVAPSPRIYVALPNRTDAKKAGYLRYTPEDETGAISYANLQWQSADIRHPSQLWYDKNGLLFGADYSISLAENPSRPQFGASIRGVGSSSTAIFIG